MKSYGKYLNAAITICNMYMRMFSSLQSLSTCKKGKMWLPVYVSIQF